MSVVKKILYSLIVVLGMFTYACQKEVDESELPIPEDPNKLAYDSTLLMNKDWKISRTPNPLIILRLNSDKSGFYKLVTDLNTYTYYTVPFTWKTIKPDSVGLMINSPSPFKIQIRYVNDTLLLTHNWVVGGITDTSTVSFYYEP